jgi:hypothetical protein
LDPKAKHVEKILDVQQGEISYLVGTIYMDMKLKPNILDDITKDVRMQSRDGISGLMCHFVNRIESSPSYIPPLQIRSIGLQPNPTGQSTQTTQIRFTWKTSLVVSG